ncbi:hypothetical protein DFA_06315 [Cavenderia fasciculata]|uniref:Uncharacterized protein n=1 Tax=Cavenderia fasciculata TaxID=261658 RepID=F4PKP5_CACFS|nr:uncharacterized protein DFA_06315 [Cavenderia fasciculata]EGG24169.1 hypothetical protein DFA_06315 [Cavenderia fasciculata]|eukprot:XP_004362020.1 hypothetical protein DFA_06315 [Cavenderia fasciculata]
MSLLKLSNLLLLHIISQIDNGDTICLLTCKRLYGNSSSVRRLITFKGIRVITDKGQISLPYPVSQQFQATATRFKLNTFKDILKNSISDQHVVHPDTEYFDDYPQWIQQRISSSTDRTSSDKSSITTVLVNNDQPSSTLKSLYNDIPSVETLFIDGTKQQLVFSYASIDLGSIALLPRLEYLSVYCANQVKLGQHTTLRSLKLDVGTSCTLSDLGLKRFVSLTDLSFKNHFVSSMGPDQLPISLTSLTIRLNKTPPRDTFHSLKPLVKLKITLQNVPGEVEAQEQGFFDLEHLRNLETFKITDNNYHPTGFKYSMEISIPPSIKTLTIRSNWVRIPSQCVMPLLETLRVDGSIFIDGRVSLITCQSLKKTGIYYKCHSMTFPSDYPPNLETIDLLRLKVDHLVLDNIPPCITKLLMPLTKSGKLWRGGPRFYSITSRLTKAISQQPQWLPLNTTHLTCKLWGEYAVFVFRLDEVINHTNVRDLSIIIDNFSSGPLTTYHFAIQRLDADNRNVLVLEKQSLTGGIITQRQITTNNQQQQQDDQQTQSQYHPIYLHFETRSDSPYELKWSFAKDKYKYEYINYDSDDDDSS